MVESVDKTSCAWHCSSVLSHSVSDGKIFCHGCCKIFASRMGHGGEGAPTKNCCESVCGLALVFSGGEGSCKYLEYSMFLVVSRLQSRAVSKL